MGEGKGLFHRRYTQEHACPIREEEKKDPRGVTSPFPSPTREQNRRNFSAMTPLPPSPPLTTAIKTLFLGRDHNFSLSGSCAKNPPLVFFSRRGGDASCSPSIPVSSPPPDFCAFITKTRRRRKKKDSLSLRFFAVFLLLLSLFSSQFLSA